jgi:DNA repair exonuclease SbcCD ATPase subunit
MIKQLVNQGFKDQCRTIRFSGMDLFTSNDVNGVGKSSVLEAVKLALLGEIPGKAKSLDDLLQFTSFPEMSVKILAATQGREICAERRFLCDAKQGEKRPVVIDQSPRRYEEGDRWIRDTLGAISLGFDPYEFLNLTDQKKRQWLISLSPESRELNREVLHAVLFARLVEIRFGSGLVQEQLFLLGLEKLDNLFDSARSGDVSKDQPVAGAAIRLVSQLSEIVGSQDPDWVKQISDRLESISGLWNKSASAEENITAIHSHLKTEILRLKNAVGEQSNAIECLALPDDADLDNKISVRRENIILLSQEIEKTVANLEKLCSQIEEGRRIDERLRFLQESMDGMVQKLCSDSRETVKAKLLELEEKFIDTRTIQDELDRLNNELNEFSEMYNREENNFSVVSESLRFRRKKLASLMLMFRAVEHMPVSCATTAGGWDSDDASMKHETCEVSSGSFHCPIAAEIKCETDLRPYRDLLELEIKALEQKEAGSKAVLEKAQDDLRICGGTIRELRTQVKRQLQANDGLRQEIRILQEKFSAEERALARAQGQLEACREEAESLRNKKLAGKVPEYPGLVEMNARLESKKTELHMRKRAEEEDLAFLLREQGRASAAAQLARKRKALEAELKDVRQVARLLGPEGIQGEMAKRISGALEKEVNEALKLINADFEFTIDLSGARFLMGWNRDGKVIPFKTINSAHFVLFIVPFLAVILNRMGRIREKEGLATLKVLCIEAESMTAANLSALLKGLSLMKAKGYLDNVLVAHYSSIRDPEKLHGFKEHILTEEGEE